MPMIRAVIFDVDGTLVDSVDLHARAWKDAFAEFDYSLEFQTIRAQIGKGGDQLMPVFMTQADLRDWGPALEKRRSFIFKQKYLPEVVPFPDVADLFRKLRRDGIRIVLASSCKQDELAVYKQLAGITDLVDAETASEDAEKSKPYPDIFDAAIGKLHGIQPADILVVGDSPYDAEAAGKANLDAIAVSCGGFPEQDLMDAGFLAVYRDPSHLLESGNWLRAG
jgi:phosphoglycolate phosphatase-like HAD superfamily hydrolase